MVDKVELLAPAGDMECAKVAVYAGADAVYFGLNQFSARATAGNFGIDASADTSAQVLIDFCHLHGVKAFCAINILLDNEELVVALNYVSKLYYYGVDAVIVQDLGLIKAIRDIFPDLPVHASTQMSVHNIRAVRFLEKLGVRRVILSRELTLKEIKYICSKAEMEIEVFVHGSLCISYSGQCLFSSFTQNRSANRGRCAQMCRQVYSVGGKSGYFLNPKDNCQINRIPELSDAGVKSFKIEGRMKSPQYVTVVVNVYRKAIDGKLDRIDCSRLEDVFNRWSVEGYLDSRRKDNLIEYESPKHRGAVVGKIISFEKGVAKIKLKKPVFVGDGFVARADGEEFGFRYPRNGRVGETVCVKVNIRKDYQNIIVGKDVCRTVSSRVNEFYSKMLCDSKKVGVAVHAVFKKEGSFIEFCRGNHKARVGIDRVSDAVNVETSKIAIKDAITSFGDDDLVAGPVDITVSKGLNISLSEVKKARRELVGCIKIGNRRDKIDVSGWVKDNLVERDKKSCKRIKRMDYIEGDVIVRGDCRGENGEVVNNLGCLKKGVEVIGPHINIFNSVAFDLINDMFSPCWVILSRELTIYQIRNIVRKSRYCNAGVIVEENTPLMYMEHCVSKDVSSCDECKDVLLVDRIGKVLSIEKKDCVNIIRNADRLDLSGMIPQLQKAGVAVVFSDKRLFGDCEKKTKGHFFKRV